MWSLVAAASCLVVGSPQTIDVLRGAFPPMIEVQQASAKDTSGVTALRSVLETWGQVKSLHVFISRGEATDGIKEVEYDGTVELWYEAPNRFRMEYQSMWGDGVRRISDGKTELEDFLTDRAVLRNASGTLTAAGNRNGLTSSAGFYLQLVGGLKGWDEIVDANRDITLTKEGHVVFTHKSGPQITLRMKDGRMTGVSFRARGVTSVQDDFQQVVFGARIPRNAFSTQPSDGLPVIDQRRPSSDGAVRRAN